jgi:hypothetical protein
VQNTEEKHIPRNDLIRMKKITWNLTNIEKDIIEPEMQ